MRSVRGRLQTLVCDHVPHRGCRRLCSYFERKRCRVRRISTGVEESMDALQLKLLQRRLAQTAVTGSSARKMGPKGTIGAARTYFADLDLNRLRQPTERRFQKILNRVTTECVSVLPTKAKRWGPARKWTNIFLRDVAYNTYMNEAYQFEQQIPWLEIPLDGHVAHALRSEEGGDSLSEWNSVIRLDETTSREYQLFASIVAKRKAMERVHLDLIYWRRPEKARCFPFSEIDRIENRPGIYEIHTKTGIPLKVGIGIDLQTRVRNHANSYQSCLVLMLGGTWRNPQHIRSTKSILAKHLYFDRTLSSRHDLRREQERQRFLSEECQVFVRYTRTVDIARKLEREREVTGMFRYLGDVRLRVHRPLSTHG